VSLDFSYYLTDGFNEEALGFASDNNFGVGFASGHLTASSGKNFYIVTTPEGTDATSAQTPGSVIGIGNAYISDYTLDVSVGSIPTVSVSLEAANINADTAIGGKTSSGILDISTPAIAQTDGAKLTTEVQLPAVTTRFPFARTVDFPVTASLNVSAIVNEVTAANLADIIDSQNAVEINLTLNKAGTSTAQSSYKLKGAKLDSESISSSIGSNKTVDLTFSTQIGGPTDSTNNILYSGASNEVAFA
jgi:hypothetical protein